MLASPTSRWSAGAALLTLLVLAASWFLLISPRKADASALHDQATAAQGQTAALQIQIAQLKAQFADLPKRKAELAAIKQQLPATGDMPALVRSMQDYAAASGVTLESLTPGIPSIYSPDGVAPTGAVTTAAAGSVIQLPLNITVTGDYFEDALFVKSLQTKLKRVLLITSVSVDSTNAVTAVTGATPSTPSPDVTSTTGTTGITPTPTTGTMTTTTPGGASLQLTSSVFVLVDDTTTLQDVADQAKQATAKAGAPAKASSNAT